MNIKLVLIAAVVLVVTLHGASVTASKETRARPEYNIKTSLDAVSSSFTAMITKLITHFASTIYWVVDVVLFCVLPGISTTHITPAKSAEFSKQLIQVLEASGVNSIPEPRLPDGFIEDFCNKESFKILHDFMWKDDPQLRDLIRFLYDFKYDDIYEKIRQVYVDNNCPVDLLPDLPVAPPPLSANATSQTSHSQHKSGRHRRDLPVSHPPQPFAFGLAQAEACDLQLLARIGDETFLGELLGFVITFLSNMNEPTLHFLMGKVQEPIKGEAFRKFRELQPIDELLTDLHNQMKADPVWNAVFTLVKDLLGLDFWANNILKTLLALIELLLWGLFFPLPPV